MSSFYEVIDALYKIEMDMNKVVVDASWIKCLNELNMVRDDTWLELDTDITIWEVITEIKTYPNGDTAMVRQ